jgi:RimJ/RimL family protein N-acetyltransferase
MENKYSIVKIDKSNIHMIDSLSNGYRPTSEYYDQRWAISKPEFAFILYGGQHIGFIKWVIYNGMIDIRYFMIDINYQGKHLGKGALNEALKYIRHQHPNMSVTLLVDQDNEAAVKIYLGAGFKFMESDDQDELKGMKLD